MIKKISVLLIIALILSFRSSGMAASFYISGDSEKASKHPLYRNNIVNYYLPKNLLQVNLTYSVYLVSPTTPPRDKHLTFNVRVLRPPTISKITVPDQQLNFFVHLNHLNDWLTSTTVGGLKIGDDGVLQSVDTTFDDRTAQIIENSVDTAANIAKAITAFGALNAEKYVGDVSVTKIVDPDIENPDPTTPGQDTGYVATTLPTATATADKTPDISPSSSTMPTPALPTPPKPVVTPGESIDADGKKHTLKYISLRSIDERFSGASSFYDSTDIAAVSNLLMQLKTGLATTNNDVINFPDEINLVLTDYVNPFRGHNMEELINDGKILGLLKPTYPRYKGVIVREPKLVRTDVEVTQTPPGGAVPYRFRPCSNRILIAQTGGFTRIPIKKAWFSTVQTSVTVGSAGSVTQYSGKHSSPLETITQMLQHISGDLTPFGTTSSKK